MLSPEGTVVPLRNQSVAYTSFQRPSRVDENGLSASFTYNAAGDRVKMYVANGTTPVLTRYYIGGQYELDAPSNTERLYLGGDAYSAPAVYVKEAGNWKIHYICRDYLGSITHIANADGSLKQELSYDAWGRLRNPSTQVAYAPGSEPALFLGRGYPGHEYLPWFGLVNMNARLYDPALGRFLSPDPYVQMPDFSQNFNRYSYALNNPLMYVDKNGEFFFMPILVGMAWGALIGAATSAVIYTVQVGITSGFKDFNLSNLGMAALMGGVGGAVGAAIDGKNIGKGLLQGAKNGAIAGGTLAGLNVVSMGATYKPDISYGEFDDYTPVYRRGHFLWPKSAGMTVGRNLVTRLTGDDPDYDSYLQAHETGHLDQQAKMGFANFYGEILKEYLTEGFYASYDIPNTLEHGANLYSLNRIGYFWSNKYGRITKQNYDYYY